VAQKVKTAEIVRLAEGILPRGLLRDREKLGGYNLAAILKVVSVVLMNASKFWFDRY
jgi:hypothetical protein